MARASRQARVTTALHAKAMRRLCVHAAARAAADARVAPSDALARSASLKGALLAWRRERAAQTAMRALWSLEVRAQGRPCVRRWQRAAARRVAATFYLQSRLEALVARRTRGVISRWRCAAAESLRVAAARGPVDTRAAEMRAAAIGRAHATAMRQAMRRWRGTLSPRVKMFRRSVKLAMRVSLDRWRCESARSWGAKELTHIGAAAALSLSAHRCLAGWRAAAASVHDRLRLRKASEAQVRAQVVALWSTHELEGALLHTARFVSGQA